jgi:hypothetical protein
VNEREEEPFEERPGFLTREAARETGSGGIEERNRSRDRIGLRPDVDIEKQPGLEPRGLCELPAGVLLAAPAGWERRAAHEPHAGILGGQPLDDRTGAVGRVVVENHEFEIDAAAGEHVAGQPFDHSGLIAGRHEHGDRGEWSMFLGPWCAAECPEIR